MAIFAFFIVCVLGLIADMDVADVLLRALAAMAVFFFIGLLVGYAANKILLDGLFGDEVRDIGDAIGDETDAQEQGSGLPGSD